MSSTSVTFSGFVYDADGVAVQSATVNIYAKNTVTPSLGSTTTDSSGFFGISSTNASVTSSGGDLAISHPTSGAIARRKWADEMMYKTLNLESLFTGSINSTGGGALLGTWSNLGAVTIVDINGGTLAGVTVDGALTWSAAQNFGAYQHFINETANTSMTVGLTINQGANDNEILAFKSSDVAHGVTSAAETDTYGLFKKQTGVAGGLNITGITDTNISNDYESAIFFWGIRGAAAPTAKSTSGWGVFRLNASIASGASTTVLGANGNIISVESDGGVQAIFDAEGDIHVNAGGGAGTASLAGSGTAVEHSTETVAGYNVYDEYPDWQIARALHASLVPNTDFGTENRELVERYQGMMESRGLVTYNEDGNHFISMKRLGLFNLDGLFQMGQFVMDIASVLTDEQKAALPGRTGRLLALHAA